MASGHVNRVNRPDTWLHRPMLQNVKKALANPEPSTHGTWGHDPDDVLSFPTRASMPRGASVVQIQRTVYAGRYRDAHASPGGHPHDVAGGERSIPAQYLEAIGAARSSIYIENQAIPVPEIAAALEQALQRGVEVVMLVPADPEDSVRRARQDPQRKPLFDSLAELDRFENFAPVGIAALDTKGRRGNIYVHSKIMLVDDAWATIGSCNLHSYSLSGNAEMNASIWDPQVVRALRCQLLAEHLDRNTSGSDDRAALCLYREVARGNRRRREANDGRWQGLAFSLDPTTYGA